MRGCRHCLSMDYGCSGSGADTSDAPNVFINYFKYQSTATWVNRTSYANASAWMQVFKTEVQAGRPSQLRIQDPNAVDIRWWLTGTGIHLRKRSTSTWAGAEAMTAGILRIVLPPSVTTGPTPVIRERRSVFSRLPKWKWWPPVCYSIGIGEHQVFGNGMAQHGRYSHRRI